MRTPIATLVLLSLLCPGRLEAGPPPPIPQWVPPSNVEGRVESQWVAPFVQLVQTHIRRTTTTEVRWYAQDGTLLERSGALKSNSSPFANYFLSGAEDGLTFHGMYGGWRLEAPSPEHYGIASRDGRVFAQFLRDKETAIGMSMFVEGEHTADLGPFPGMTLMSQSVGFDGSAAVLLIPDGSSRPPHILVSDSQGHLLVSAQAPALGQVAVGPDATHLLLWNQGGEAWVLNQSGEFSRVAGDSVLSGPWYASWHPQLARVVLAARSSPSYVLIDCDDASVTWHVTAPGKKGRRSVQPFGDYVFQKGSTPARPEHSDSGYRRFIRALNLDTGDLVAEWWSTASPAYTDWQDSGRLMMRDDRLYFVASDEFSEIRIEDVEKAGEGCCTWQLPSADQGEYTSPVPQIEHN